LDPSVVFAPTPKLDTPGKLLRELKRQRRLHAPFMRNLAPTPEPTCIVLPIEEFDWRLQESGDLSDPARPARSDGQWEKVPIPHYGGPLGRATAYYRTAFQVTDEMLERGAVYVCFRGVDYKAHVFVNEAYVGSHEGFFGAFEFDCTDVVRRGENTLLVRVENDAICMGNDSWGEDGELYEGDKIYAATGPGYDDPVVGWHHCSPGMGIYQDVCMEARAPTHIHDVFVRPLLEENRAEAWVEVRSRGPLRSEIALELSVYGQNFRKTVFQDRPYELPGPAGPGISYFRLPFEVPNPRVWDLASPWLYQAQVRLRDAKGEIQDVAVRQFGMRSFRMEENQEPRGRLYLNGRQIRLRGANTMGHEQQCVMKRDWEQLRDDILLAKICHMNFLRLTSDPCNPRCTTSAIAWG
jgi:beta-galactosidase/beta-glucuronidase